MNYSPEPTGNAPYTTSLAEGLHERGFAVRVITAFPYYPTWRVYDGFGGWSSIATENGVRVERKRHFIPARPGLARRLLSEVSFGFRLLFARWGRPDVVLFVSPALFSGALASWKARGLPTAAWVQDLYSLGFRETRQGSVASERLVWTAESGFLRRMSGVSAIHERFKKHITEQLGVTDEKVQVIRNWSHLPGEPGDTSSIRERLGWSPGELIALHAGNIGVKQGLENVVEAARLADEQGANVRFVLLGDGNRRREVEEFARGVSRIDFIDPLPSHDFETVLAAADVLLVNELPSVTEMSVPSKLTSYFTAGRPVVAATDEGSVTAGEIEASNAGLRVPAGQPQSLLDAILALSKDLQWRQDLGLAGTVFKERHLSEAAAIDRYAEWLTAIVEQHEESSTCRKRKQSER